MKATSKVTGVQVEADEAVIKRLGPEWQPVKPAARKAPAKSDSK